jgi:methylenetetrahydrofolate reductase (NADPH)
MKSSSRLEALFTAGEFVLTAECGPPRGADVDAVKSKAAHLIGYCDAVNVTDNQTSIVRMSSVAASKIILDMGLEPVMQMVCRDRNRIAMQSDIFGAAALGISNLLCLSGDHQKFGNHPGAKNVYDVDSIQLLDILRRLRDEGKLECGDEVEGRPRIFAGAAENPFADPFEFRVIRLAKKVAAGADFIQTQCIYDMPKFRRFMQQVVDRGLDKKVHILAGVTPIRSRSGWPTTWPRTSPASRSRTTSSSASRGCRPSSARPRGSSSASNRSRSCARCRASTASI